MTRAEVLERGRAWAVWGLLAALLSAAVMHGCHGEDEDNELRRRVFEPWLRRG